MPNDLLCDVMRPADATQRARRWYVLPLSIGAHAAAAAALLIIPLAAEVERPAPVRPASHFTHVMPASLPDVPLPKGNLVPDVRRMAAPVQAPSLIEPETNEPVTASGPPEGPPIPGPRGVPDGLELGYIGTRSAIVALPKPESKAEPQRVGGVIREPRKVFDVAPTYPPIAIAAKKEGVVILEAVIDERGNVVRLKVLRSEPLLDAAAISAVERWRYTPTLLNNVPVPVLMTITVRFRLN